MAAGYPRPPGSQNRTIPLPNRTPYAVPSKARDAILPWGGLPGGRSGIRRRRNSTRRDEAFNPASIDSNIEPNGDANNCRNNVSNNNLNNHPYSDACKSRHSAGCRSQFSRRYTCRHKRLRG